MQTKPYSLQSPEDIAKEYGGNKQSIAKATQMGLIDPTAAVLAGMFIDRMRNAVQLEQAPQQTVADQVFAPAQPPAQPPAGLGATAPAQGMAPPPMQPPAQSLAPAMAGGGLLDIPVSESMYNEDSFAGGGIIAFAPGGLTGTFDAFAPQGEYEEFSSYQPMFPSVGEGNRRYKLKQLGYTNDQILKMTPAQQEFVLQNVSKPSAAVTPAITPAAAPASSAAPAVAPVAALRDYKDTDTGVDLTGVRKPSGTTIEEWRQQQREFGINNDDFKTKLEASIAKLAKSGGDREEAKNMALLAAGLGIAGGTSQYALQNIAQGAMAGVSQYGKDIKEIKSAERDAEKMRIELAKAEDARNRDDFKAYQDHIQKAKDLELKLRKADVDEKVAQAQIKYYGRPGPAEEVGIAAEKYPWLKDRYTGGTEARVRAAAEEFVSNPALVAQDPKLRELIKKAKNGDKKAIEDLEIYKNQLRSAYIARNLPGSAGGGGAASDPLGLR